MQTLRLESAMFSCDILDIINFQTVMTQVATYLFVTLMFFQMVIEVIPSFRCVATSNKQTKLLKNYCCKPMWKYKFLFDVKSFCKNHRCICVSYLPSKLLLLLPTLLQVFFDQAKRLVIIVNIMHSFHLRNKLCLIIKICIFKNHFLVKNKLQTPQLNPYLLVSPHPSRFSSLLNLGHHFYF